MIRRMLACLALAWGLGGCVSLTPQQCATADWYRLGHDDSARGAQPRIGRHVDACARAGIAADQPRYAQGYRDGLDLYCRPQVVMSLALRGEGSPDVCPIDQRAGLLPYHRAGRQVLDATRAVDDLALERGRLSRELGRDDVKPERRQAVIRRLRELERDLDRAHHERLAAEHRLVEYQALLAR
ncbi:DUF2799 domain-containing protein [Luteimonas sp. BDR2-5]|uniref:DUF2799 domain-containing protein n=1 Tax=Proluteimonas luteida TaxID=2878685 RepID=UPI001E2F7BB9|nr:DUF2799 domain-containing protein [Luteimonas sp. BDR2-5]MCD9027434.1 DUF2799 domain-containing protein [Luteimonas sp. BDR2-5]